MTQTGTDHLVPSYEQRMSVVPLSDGVEDSVGGTQLEGLARDLRAWSRELDGMSRGGDGQGAEFIQLDRAVRHLLAAAHAIDTTDSATKSLFEERHSSDDCIHRLAQGLPEPPSLLIKRIFSVGLQLAALECLLTDGALKDRAAAAVEELDLVIRDIRLWWIKELEHPFRERVRSSR